MKSGKMAHVITAQRFSTTISAAGTPAKTWADLAKIRAELIERSTEEFLWAQGA